MVRISRQSHQRRVMVAMTIYVIVFLWVWPLARAADTLWLKAAYALAPVPPLLYAIWLLARRVLSADELEQRTHLIGIGVAAAAISVFGIVSGFLAAAHVFPPEWAAEALVWIFPLLMLCYGGAQLYAARRYGGGVCDEGGMPVAIRFLYAATLCACIAAYFYFRKGDRDASATMLGMAGGMAVFAGGFAVWRWLRGRSMRE